MPKLPWFDKALGSWLRFRDEIAKVSQLGKTGVSRSFLVHERLKLVAVLGELAYRYVHQHGTQDVAQKRVVEQIERLSQRIILMDDKVSGLTQDLSLPLDAEEGNDLLKKKGTLKKNRKKK